MGCLDGKRILNEIESSNLIKTEYDTETKKLVAEFKNGMIYEYEDVPHQIYTQFRSAKSQGSFFNSQISKVFKYIKIS